MKNVVIYGMLISLALISCSKEDEKEKATPLVANFDAIVTGESPNAKIIISNQSTGATKFSWTFGQGANIASSTEENPDTLFVDKAGEFEIKLVVSNDKEEKELTKTVSVAGHNAIITYTDVEFGLEANNSTYGRFFSFETGRIYKDSEIDTSTGPKIHLAFGSMANTMYYFQSPSVKEYNIPNATVTKVNNLATSIISTDAFDAMTDDSLLAGITVNETDDSFGNSSIPGTILFQLANGKKGVIKTKSVNSERLLVDIKIQKYE